MKLLLGTESSYVTLIVLELRDLTATDSGVLRLQSYPFYALIRPYEIIRRTLRVEEQWRLEWSWSSVGEVLSGKHKAQQPMLS